MINIAILGYGVVGSGVAEVCEMNADSIAKKVGKPVIVKKILDVRNFPGDRFESKLTKNADEVFNDSEISIIIETIGGVNSAYEFTKRALLSGKHVVTSNKELVATHGPELLKLAISKKLNYLFEASVGGGIPIIRPLVKSFGSEKIKYIFGILNGTTNYILTKMKNDSLSFDDALLEAQELGFAEQNPKDDIQGMDACRKLAILSSIVIGEFVDYSKIYTQGIEKITYSDILYADRLGYKIKLVASFKNNDDNTFEAFVAPVFLPDKNPLTVADGVYNAILIEGNAVGSSMFYGKGAGKMATASAVVSDIIETALHLNSIPHALLWEETAQYKMKNHRDCKVEAFLRLSDGEETELLINQLKMVTDISFMPKEYDGEIALIAGMNGKLTEGTLADIIDRKPCCLSMIRIL